MLPNSRNRPEAADDKTVRLAAMNLLARRDHSAAELEQKLRRRFEDGEQVRGVVRQLQHDGLQSDACFAESYTRYRASRGFGAGRIRIELRQKGVDDVTAENALQQADINWQALLRQQFEKKFAACRPESLAEKAKQMRFFQHRGFSRDSVNALWAGVDDNY